MKTKDTVGKGEYIKGAYLKYEWLIIRQDLGHLCGYVKLWKGHLLEPLFKKEHCYHDIDIDCHGGLTFSEKVTNKHKYQKTLGFTNGCWIGWDYAHAGDYMEGMPFSDGHIWTEEEVIKECHEVIDQLTEKYL